MRRMSLQILMVTMLATAPIATVMADPDVSIVFSQDEVRIIASWYRDHGSETRGNGKGRGKSGGLPPGIAKNLARGKTLPPGIAKRYLPPGLVSALPPPPRGFERVIVDGRVLLVEVATQVVHDVLTDLIVR